mgnify:CR=1 FL=1
MTRTTSSLEIEAARLDDLDALDALEQACFDTDRLSKRRLRHWILASNGLMLVARREGVLLVSIRLPSLPRHAAAASRASCFWHWNSALLSQGESTCAWKWPSKIMRRSSYMRIWATWCLAGILSTTKIIRLHCACKSASANFPSISNI